MPIKLLPHLRLLNTSLSVTRFPSMNLQPSIRTVPSFSRIFPFKLRFLGLTRLHQQPQVPGVRRLSTRPFRSRPGSASGSNWGRSRERGSTGREVRASKSLIEDEAELSDWVSELGSDSYRAKSNNRFGDDEESDFRTARGGRGRERDSFPMKRKRENDSNDFRDSRGRLNRKPANTNTNSVSRFNRRFDVESRDNDNYSRKSSRGIETGNGDSFREKRNERGRFKKEGMKLRKEARFSDDDDIIADDDEDVARVKGFGDLLGEEGSDVDDDSDGDVQENARNLIGLDKTNGAMSVKRSSPGKGNSYLSESRCALQRWCCFQCS